MNPFLKYLLIPFIVFSFLQNGVGQIFIDTVIHSEILNQERQIKITLPANYGKSERQYPVIYTLDGNHVYEPLSTAVTFYSRWDKIPPSIVVGIYHLDRWDDCNYHGATGELYENGILFYRFVKEELVPMIEAKYRTTHFNAIYGHSFTANYIHYYLLDDQSPFRGYAAISPFFAPNLSAKIHSKLTKGLNDTVFYYLTTSEFDLKGHITSIEGFKKILNKCRDDWFIWEFDDFKYATHVTLAIYALPRSLEHIFSRYRIMGVEEYEQMLRKSTDPMVYLVEYYDNINRIYGTGKKIREDDIISVAGALAEKGDWEQLKDLGELSLLLFPETPYGYYYLGEYFEKKGDLDQALKNYKTGYGKLSEDVLNKPDFYVDIERVENLLNHKKP